MKILILAAMDKELNLLLNLLDQPVEKTISSGNVWAGHLDDKEIYLSKCGIGKVNSAINTYRLIHAIKPDLVINSGVAGGAGVAIGTILVADRIAYDDVWCGPGTEFGQADGMPLFMEPDKAVLNKTQSIGLTHGLICSGDKFISKPEEIAFIRSKFPDVKAVDMESASIAQACILSHTRFAVIRIVSDTPGEGENISQYKDFWATAPEKTFSALSDLLRVL